MQNFNYRRGFIASILGYISLFFGQGLLFGNPLIHQVLFSASSTQSEKAIAVWTIYEPLPPLTPFWDDLTHVSLEKIVVQALLFFWMLAVVYVFSIIRSSLPGSDLKKGIYFGVGLWLTVFWYFEIFTPFNLFGEPFHLMLLELALQLIVSLITGIVISTAYKPASEA